MQLLFVSNYQSDDPKAHFQQHRYCSQFGNYHLHNLSSVDFITKNLYINENEINIFKLFFCYSHRRTS